MKTYFTLAFYGADINAYGMSRPTGSDPVVATDRPLPFRRKHF